MWSENSFGDKAEVFYYLPQSVIHTISAEQTHLFSSAFRTSPGHLSSEEAQWETLTLLRERGEMMALPLPDTHIKQHKSSLSKGLSNTFQQTQQVPPATGSQVDHDTDSELSLQAGLYQDRITYKKLQCLF